ncbi:hypothetical protein D3C71_1661030 [compost metagenome]
MNMGIASGYEYVPFATRDLRSPLETQVLDTLIDAIRNQRVITFNYSGFTRTAEPHTVGISRAGNQVLRCFQTHGGHVNPGHEWDLCELSQISNLITTNTPFHPRPSYRRGDKGMTHIYAEV